MTTDSQAQNGDRTAHVQVLLATFNGARYLEAQLRSIFAQDWPEFSVVASDDGSSDETLRILKQYQRQQAGRMEILPAAEGRLGPMRNFERLMQATNASYVAFSDQDDIWDGDKLSRCMECLLSTERDVAPGTPLLVYTDLRIVSSSGVVLADSLWRQARVHPVDSNFNQMLAQNLVTGCTMVVNRALIDLSLPLPAEAIMHDYWMALLASAFGIAVALKGPSISYRQHGSNTIGAGGKLSLAERTRRIFADPELMNWLPQAAAQAAVFKKLFQSQLTLSQSDALSAMAGILQAHPYLRPPILMRHGITRTDLLNQTQFALRLFFGKASS